MSAFVLTSTVTKPVLGADTARVTTSFEVRHAESVLRQVAKVVESGFTRSDADRLAREIDRMRPDQPMNWQFQVVYRGVTYALRVQALLDDLGMVDLDFATDAALAPSLRSAVDGYLNSRNL
jgi:hypothetical protein